ncbi:DUF4292 domain-containing protein [Flavimarina sp. Hel_I_48]|uniref:DUF4292 domain-containing protein n=1 Tax=Flavimarina sp. Hel_I_48 TaxID=1392488 RepID=UPI0004DF2C05|nr:DUF4292 domain-containing protein [Flavimarina sp. Hel_I_48]
MKYTFSILFCFVLLLSGCKSTRTAVTPEDLASAKIIESHYDTHFDFNTLAAKLKVRYKDEHTTQGVSVSLRMEKDKTIWMSASILGISLAKAKITPDHVQYYEKIDGTYFDGDFELLSELLGTALDFKQVQALLLGQPIFELNKGGYNAIAGQQNYLVVPKKQRDLFSLFFYLDPQRFTMQQQRLQQKNKDRELTVSYSDYAAQNIGILPEEVLVRAKEGDKTTEIDISYRNVEVNEEVSFPFEIPGGYKEIEL